MRLFRCKKDSKRSYKGTEPSPKGLGYCVHYENEGAAKTKKYNQDSKVGSYRTHDNGGNPFLVEVYT